MLEYKQIIKFEYAGAVLQAPLWLVRLFPHDLPLSSWPSFCGAGESLGDWLVPERTYGAIVSPACYIHDQEWATARKSWREFQNINNRFLANIFALQSAQLTGYKKNLSAARAELYWIAVSTCGWLHFDPTGTNPYSNPVVRQKLNRLARAQLGLK